MAIAFAVNNGNWSDTNTWSGSYIPQPGDDVYSNNRIVDVDTSFEVSTLRNTSGTGITAGGSFRFLSGSISGSVNTISVGGSALISVTATTGSVYFNALTSLSIFPTGGSPSISYTGNCDLYITTPLMSLGNAGYGFTMILLNKTSSGTLYITGNISATAGANAVITLNSTNGNTVIAGNVTGGPTGNTRAVVQTAGNITVTGNVTGGTSSTCEGITFSGTQLITNGNVTGGTISVGISTSGPVNIINGTVTGGSVAAISSTTANQINISGSVVASANAVGVSSTNGSGIVILNGNITNNAGRQAIYCQNLFLSDTGTTQARFFTSGSQDRTLYSANTFPNLPSSSIVRSTTLYGPGNELSGSIIMPDPANVRYGVPTDNTTGSALLSAETLFDEIAISSNPVAVRLRKSSTTDTFGNMLTAFKK
jgi:hypothetical protein